MSEKNDTREWVAELLSAFSGQQSTLTIPRAYIDVTGSIEVALFLSQVVYWSDRTTMEDGWFAKSYAEWKDEIALSKYQVMAAVKALSEAGLETVVKKFKGAPTVHYRLGKAVFSQWIVKKLDERKLKNLTNDSQETERSSTEITTEIRTENKDSVAPEVAKSANPDSKPVPSHRKEPLANLKAAMTRTIDKYVETGVIPGAEAKKESDHEHKRKNDPMYDAIFHVWKYTAGRNTNMAKMLLGVATDKAHKKYNLEQPMTPDKLLRWACWYRKTELHGDDTKNMLEVLEKVQSSITYWQSIGEPSANGITADRQAHIDALKAYKPADPNTYIGAQNNG